MSLDWQESTIAVSVPGGDPRHFRVQYFDTKEMFWHRHDVYNTRVDAEEALQQLASKGLKCRILEFGSCAAAR
ncbi:hypothetical protein M4951_04455 [Blastopirellula sp. J2-11]|uniref:hypothetical protein n=1 Tax=Blastopirellula sp. J2-11 TaxID=2943192 RepID=UPI0021C5A26B|nr:hypothetical protein [Blastopirellula sp. J2-11]UUO07562.1 hypothetical protein M4951_04455 [Blastopirellula sp. J2-11]